MGLGVAGVALLWLTFLAFTIRFFVTSFVTACWWFDTDGGDALPTAADGSGVLRPASTGAPGRRGLGLAFGKSFGTLSLAASVLTACEIVNNMARNAERRSNNICVCLVMCCLQCIMRYIQWLTKFCVAWHAVTAQPFCTSARGVFDMLGRHGLAALVVDRFTSLVMHMGSLFLALVASCAGLRPGIARTACRAASRCALPSMQTDPDDIIEDASEMLDWEQMVGRFEQARPRHPAAGAPTRTRPFVRRQAGPAIARAARLKRRHQTE